jgi:hypothetical protein
MGLKNDDLKKKVAAAKNRASQSQSTSRQNAIANPNQKFPYMSSSGAYYSSRKELTEGRPTNPAKLKSDAQKTIDSRKKVASNKSTKFPYTSSSGAMYANREDLMKGRPSNPSKFKKQ